MVPSLAVRQTAGGNGGEKKRLVFRNLVKSLTLSTSGDAIRVINGALIAQAAKIEPVTTLGYE